jgi:chorismate synthase
MSLRLLTAGESHGSILTAILDGMPAGLPMENRIINLELARRQKGFGSGGRMKIETDKGKILSGVMDGETTGAPISILVENADHINWKGKAVAPMTTPRPGHADLTGAVKYGYRDLRPALERASARETVLRVAMGAICKHFLAQFGIFVGGYVCAIGEIEAQIDRSDLKQCYEIAETNEVRCPDLAATEKMKICIEEIIQSGDTLGGIIEVFALNLPVGLGSYAQWDCRLDARFAQAIMSVQSIKGVEIGSAFENARKIGSQAQDEIRLNGSLISRPSNRAGGIEAGITNGMPILIRAAMKPIATTLAPQKTIDLATRQEALTCYERSDYCPVPRAVPVLEAMVAFVLADALIEKLGGDSLAEMNPRFEDLRQARLEDLPMNNCPIKWWE